MDEKKAYIAMYYFLENQYSLSKGEERDFFGGLLSSMSLLEDGSTADPAMWDDWIKAIQRAENDKEGVKLKFMK